ncbi:class I SAM-dependent methyltransferase, partial [Kibdelosporangium lantanae]
MTAPDPNTDPTGWFEHRYQSGAIPWNRGRAHDLLVEWAPEGTGRTAIVVGCGIGYDAEHLASLGYDTIAFDASPSAIRQARERFPDSKVHYLTGDLLNLPEAWRGAYDLVVEIRTVQSLPLPLRTDALVQDLLGPGLRDVDERR